MPTIFAESTRPSSSSKNAFAATRAPFPSLGDPRPLHGNEGLRAAVVPPQYAQP